MSFLGTRIGRLIANLLTATVIVLSGLSGAAAPAGAAPVAINKYDLTVVFGRTTIAFRDTATVHFTLRNIGSATARAFPVEILDENFHVLASRYYLNGIPANEQRDESIYLADLGNTRRVLIRVGSWNTFADADLTNNYQWVTVRYPAF